MKKLCSALAIVAGMVIVLAGCHMGEVSYSQQQSKMDKMDSIAKKSPDFAKHVRTR